MYLVTQFIERKLHEWLLRGGNKHFVMSSPRLEDLMRVKQEERRERERKEELEREKQRRKTGQELLQIKQRLQDDEMKKLADHRKKEKMEDRAAK